MIEMRIRSEANGQCVFFKTICGSSYLETYTYVLCEYNMWQHWIIYGPYKKHRIFIKFMEENPRLISCKFSADFTYKDATILWQKVTDILNSCNGVSKDWKSWRKCWQDLRSRSKVKQSKINAERKKTGGGNELNLKLSLIEEATLNLISPICIDGHTEIIESEVQIQPETEENFYIDNEVEYLEDLEDVMDDGIQIKHNSSNVNMKNTETKDNDKENILINNDANDSNENGNYLPSSIIKKRKRKSQVCEEVQSTQQSTYNLTNIAQKTYEIQNSYYESKLLLKRQKLQLKERLVNAVEKCNPS